MIDRTVIEARGVGGAILLVTVLAIATWLIWTVLTGILSITLGQILLGLLIFGIGFAVGRIR